MNYKPYQYKGTPEEDTKQAELQKRIQEYERRLEEMKKESRKYIYKTEAGRV